MRERRAQRPWLIALGLALGPAVSNGFGRFACGLVLPAMREDLGWTYTEAGWINTSNAVGYLAGALLALMVISRLGARRLFIGGMVVTAIALLASGLTRDFWLLTFWRVLAGVGGAPAFIAGGAMAAALFKGDAPRSVRHGCLRRRATFVVASLGSRADGVVPYWMDRVISPKPACRLLSCRTYARFTAETQ